jgi:hypothetical protein
VEVPAEEPFTPPIRLRTILLLCVIGAAVYWLHPRARAAWQLHAAASGFADYALCMVGPTGPALLRDNPAQFRTLARRRLIGAEANDRPFQGCAKLASDVTGSADVERVHRATAWSFVEYGGAAADRARTGSRSELTMDALAVDSKRLAQLAKDGWPFVRDGYTKLIRQSLSAHEAVHPIELARPGVGSGLPAWRAGYRSVGEVDGKLTLAMGNGANLSVFRSLDSGLNWKPAPVRGVESFAERCSAGDRSYTFTLSRDGGTMMVTSVGPDKTPHSVSLMKADGELVATSCDERALVAAVRAEGQKETQLFSCAFAGNCHAMQPPVFSGVGPATSHPVDVARVGGTTVLAIAMNGIVRVTSSRDEGHTWTPFSVAYDDAAHPDLRVSVRVPSRLVALGKRVVLYGGAPKPNETYSQLVSDDSGASWRAP